MSRFPHNWFPFNTPPSPPVPPIPQAEPLNPELSSGRDSGDEDCQKPPPVPPPEEIMFVAADAQITIQPGDESPPDPPPPPPPPPDGPGPGGGQRVSCQLTPAQIRAMLPQDDGSGPSYFRRPGGSVMRRGYSLVDGDFASTRSLCESPFPPAECGTATPTYEYFEDCGTGLMTAEIVYTNTGCASGADWSQRWGDSGSATVPLEVDVQVTYEVQLRRAIGVVQERMRTDEDFRQRTIRWVTGGTANYYARVPFSEGVPYTPAHRLREAMRLRSVPPVDDRQYSRPLKGTSDEREIKARETLARIVGMDRYLKYVKRGFLAYRAKSGRVYHLTPGSETTTVYEGRKLVQRLCIYLSGAPDPVDPMRLVQFPPTDALIVKFLMLKNDEEGFVKVANKQSLFPVRQPDMRPLVEIYEEIKAKDRGRESVGGLESVRAAG